MFPKRQVPFEGGREGKIPRHGRENSSPSDDETRYDQSVDVLLEERLRKNRTIGNIKGNKICIDNLGWAFDEKQLITELKQQLLGVKSITIASATIRGATIHFGYGCIEFVNLEAAVNGMIKLDSLYIDSPGCPFPRPILSHFPQWMTHVWGDRDIPGYVFDNGASPHFCQPNTIERQVALEWKHLQQALRTAKKRLCDIFTRGISQVLIKYRLACAQDLKSAFHDADHQLPKMSVLLYKCVSIELKNETVRDLMEMSDHCTINRIKCPVSGVSKGLVFVDVSDEAKAASLAEDMDMHLFCLGRGPRPAEVELVRFGPPSGFEGVFDRAVEVVFGVKMSYLKETLFSNSHIVDISTWQNEKKECCEQIRSLMESMQPVRFAWKLESNASRFDLHERQSDWIDNEVSKLEKLEKTFAQIAEKENNCS